MFCIYYPLHKIKNCYILIIFVVMGIGTFYFFVLKSGCLFFINNRCYILAMSDDTKESISDDTEVNRAEKGNEINTEDSDHSLDLGSISSLLGPKCAVNIDQLIDKSKEELIDTCKQMNLYIEFLHQKNSSGGN